MNEQLPAESPPSNYVPVCAIGASAGGVGTLQTLFRLLPDDLGLAYVVVLHLSPDHPSARDEIIGACTRMPVLQVMDGPTLQPNCVYVIAPDRELVIEGDSVRSRPFSDSRSRRAPIYMFFRSIAAGRGDGIAVVLTGAGSDGALGVRAIKEAGASSWCRSRPRLVSPRCRRMPSRPGSLMSWRLLRAWASGSPTRRTARKRYAASTRMVSPATCAASSPSCARAPATTSPATSRSTVLRRIQPRMQVCQIANPADYLQFLRANPEEPKELLSDLLISVTMFFRDPETFVTLSHRVIRPLLGTMGRVTLEGPAVRLRNSIVQTLALGLHELATNARNYGALSGREGHLAVSWQVRENNGEGRRLWIEWLESGVPPPTGASSDRRGYGRELIERALPYALGARTSYELGPTGVRCTIDLPLEKRERGPGAVH